MNNNLSGMMATPLTLELLIKAFREITADADKTHYVNSRGIRRKSAKIKDCLIFQAT
jgi:hypothetical protein